MGPFIPVSLGFACEVKYQLIRALAREAAKQPACDPGPVFRSPEKDLTRHIFDWQITPMAAVTRYLQADFQGVFERADLHVDEAYGEVSHRTLATRHPHEFKPVDGRLDEAAIDAGYEAARSKFEHLAQRFRRLLQTSGRYLYVCTDARDDIQVGALLDLLNARAEDHDAHLLIVSFEPFSPQMLDHGGQVHRAWRPVETPKPPIDAWQGDDAYWDEILGAFELKAA